MACRRSCSRGLRCRSGWGRRPGSRSRGRSGGRPCCRRSRSGRARPARRTRSALFGSSVTVKASRSSSLEDELVRLPAASGADGACSPPSAVTGASTVRGTRARSTPGRAALRSRRRRRSRPRGALPRRRVSARTASAGCYRRDLPLISGPAWVSARQSACGSSCSGSCGRRRHRVPACSRRGGARVQAAALEDALDRLRRGVHGVLADVREAGNVIAASNFIYPSGSAHAAPVPSTWTSTSGGGSARRPRPPTPRLSRAREQALRRGGLDALLPAGDRAERAFGANTATCWSPSNALYRGNVLLYMRTLRRSGSASGPHDQHEPVHRREAVEWWREAARYGDLIREVYFKAPNVRYSARSAATGTCATTSPSGGRADRDRDLAT